MNIRFFCLSAIAGILLVAIGLFSSGCTCQRTKEVQVDDNYSITNGVSIFNNVYDINELRGLLKASEIQFNSALMHKPEAVNNYLNLSEQALNLGIYSIDLSYCSLFQQQSYSLAYLQSITNLCTKLGIPEQTISKYSDRMMRSADNKDSLYMISSEIYRSIEQVLTKDSRDYLAALMIAGGWTEAMYIASMHCKQSPVSCKAITEQMLAQEKSLDNLIALLKVNQENILVAQYLHKYILLRKIFISIEISTNEVVRTENLKNLYAFIEQIRSDIVSGKKE